MIDHCSAGKGVVNAALTVIYLDAFIFLYDTIVLDQLILKEDGILAKFLYRLGRRGIEAATAVIVDTPKNVAYYSELFGIATDCSTKKSSAP